MASPSDIQQQVYDLLARSSNLSFVSATPEVAEGGLTITLTPGQRVTAEVLAQAQGNRVPVRIGTQQMTLDLPLQVRPGQSLELTYIADDPRPTFAMYRPGLAAPQVSLSDASRLLSLLVSNEQFMDPKQRSALQSIGDLLRRTGDASGVLGGFLDDFLTYPSTGRPVVPPTAGMPEQAAGQTGQQTDGQLAARQQPGGQAATRQQPDGQTAMRWLVDGQSVSSQQPDEPATARQQTDGQAVIRQQPDGQTTIRQQVDGQAVLRQQPDVQAASSDGSGQGGRGLIPFEDAAARLLLNLAQRSRFTLVETSNLPLHPLPLKPGDEATALVKGTLPDGRTLVQLAGETLELRLPAPVVQGEILRLALVTQQPKPVFALLGQPVHEQPGLVSDAARWMNTMLTQDEKEGDMQRAVMTRLQQIISSLPPGSPALAAIMDEAMIYAASPWLSSRSLQNPQTAQPKRDDEVVRLLQALMQGNKLALLEPELHVTAKELPFQPGQQIKAEVQQSLGNGRFMITLGDMSLNVPLPKGVRPGDSLNLFFVGSDPPTFLLVRHGKSGDALVSETGRWISTLLGMQNRSAPMEAGLGILRTLLQDAPSEPLMLQQALARGLKESGLFYEAHLSRWFSGQYPLESLLKEPQGRLSGQQLVPHQPEQTGQMTQENFEAALGGRTGTASAADVGSDPRTLPIIKEQLATLQTGQLLFQGELFPGQPMQWRVREREDGEAGGKSDRNKGENSWETSLSLTLPKLGAVDASIVLEGARVSARLHVASGEVAALMTEELAGLQEQLAAAGLEPGDLTVHHEP